MVDKIARQAPAGFPHAECQEDYVEERAENTNSLLIQTNAKEFADETAAIPKHGFNRA